MIQLTYQPAFDPFHTVFRLTRLREAILAKIALPRDHVRILDFYLLFPFRVGAITLFQRHRGLKKLANNYLETRPYGDFPEDRVLFNRISPIQIAGLDTLVNNELLNAKDYERGIVSATSKSLPPRLLDRVLEANKKQEDLIKFLETLSTNYELLGEDGLKKRSKLMEFAYDAI